MISTEIYWLIHRSHALPWKINWRRNPFLPGSYRELERDERNLYQVSDHAAEVHGPMESSPHHFLDVNLGSWQQEICLVSKMQPIQKPTNSNIKVHDWVRMIEIPQIPQPFGLSTWSRHSLANILFDLGEPGSEVVSEWKLWHVVSWKSFS